MKPELKIGFDGQAAPVIEQVRDIEGQGKRTITREHRYDAIGTLWKRGILDDAQVLAATKMQTLLQLSKLEGFAQPSQGSVGGSSGGRVTDIKLTAMWDHGAAHEALGGKDKIGSMLVRMVAEENKNLEDAAVLLNKPYRALSLTLQVALDVLAQRFGFATVRSK